MTSLIKPEVHITTPTGEDRATAIGNMHRKLVKIGRRYDRGEKKTHTDRQTGSSQYSVPLSVGTNVIHGEKCVISLDVSENMPNFTENSRAPQTLFRGAILMQTKKSGE